VDMNMPPGWNGIQTIEQIRKLNSEIPIALVTANMSTDPSIQNMLTQQRVQLFHKPYGREQLLGLVNEMSAG
ncbi:MAG: response regulator, partial [Gammaproteobacteria bacterium]|nr:response regulator [Gammaproteobacteria bacterium]